MNIKGSMQVGFNPDEAIVKISATDIQHGREPIIQSFTPAAARALADWLTDGTPNKKLRVTNGLRWVEHEIPEKACRKFALDLRYCADAVEGLVQGSA